MTKKIEMVAVEKLVNELRNQAYWINYMANQLESGDIVTCDWAIDTKLLSDLIKEASA